MLQWTSISKGLRATALAAAVTMFGIPSVFAQSLQDNGVDDTTQHKQKWPQASLQAQARDEVAHDVVKIILAAEVEGVSQDIVGQRLTQSLKGTMVRANQSSSDVKVSNGDYRVWPMSDQDGRITVWRGRAEIILESSDFVAASDLAASLSDDMVVSSLSFFVSPQARAEKEQELLGQATQAFRDRAQALATALGYAGYTLRHIDLGGAAASYQAPPRAMQSAMLKSADSIPLEGGMETISVLIQGSVFLIPKEKEQYRR